MRRRNVKPDEKLVTDLLKVLDKYIDSHPQGNTSVVLASIAAAFRMIWGLLPRAKRHARDSETGYTVVATVPTVQLEKVPA